MKVGPLFALVLAAAGPGQQCAPLGLTLTVTGERLGDPFSLVLQGTPAASGILGFDVSGGPVQTSIGTACLGLTSQMQTSAFTLDPQGTFGITGMIPPNPAMNGFGVFVQAAGLDATQPGGFALSNGQHPRLRPPRMFFRTPANPLLPHAWFSYDALTDTPGPVVFTQGHIRSAVRVPALGWYVVLEGDFSQTWFAITAYDELTGAQALPSRFRSRLPRALRPRSSQSMGRRSSSSPQAGPPSSSGGRFRPGRRGSRSRSGTFLKS
jgi:hypothetical protein